MGGILVDQLVWNPWWILYGRRWRIQTRISHSALFFVDPHDRHRFLLSYLFRCGYEVRWRGAHEIRCRPAHIDGNVSRSLLPAGDWILRCYRTSRAVKTKAP